MKGKNVTKNKIKLFSYFLTSLIPKFAGYKCNKIRKNIPAIFSPLLPDFAGAKCNKKIFKKILQLFSRFYFILQGKNVTKFEKNIPAIFLPLLPNFAGAKCNKNI